MIVHFHNNPICCKLAKKTRFKVDNCVLANMANSEQKLIARLLHLRVRAYLHQVSASMLRQLRDDSSDSVLIANNEVAWKWVATLIWSDSIVFN